MVQSLMDDLPAWARIMAWLGLPAVLSLGLVYQMSTQLASDVRRIETSLRVHEENRAHDMQSLSAYLDAICLNTANDDNERARCLNARR